MEFVLVILAGWALIYAFVIDRRRRRDTKAVDEKIKTLHSQLELAVKVIEHLEQRLRGGATAAPPAATAQPSLAPVLAISFCTKCGRGLAEAAQFCTHCGTPVGVLKPIAKPLETPPPAPKPIPLAASPVTPVQPAAAHTAPPGYAPLVVPKPAAPATEKPVAPQVAPPSPGAVPAEPGARVPPPESKPAPPPPQRPAVTAPPVAHSAAATGATASSLPRMTVAPAPPPGFAGAAPAARVTQPKPQKRSRSFEEVLGMKWLPIVGIAIVVIGVGFMVGSQWGKFHNWLRVLILYVAGSALLAGGIYLERKGRYRTLGRALIGGGWAVVALVTYAIANLKPLLVLQSKNVDLFLLLAVIGAMVWHTLKYNSQLVTGAGFLLGFIAIGMNPSAPYNLIAGAMLIAGMTVIVLRYQWFELEVFGILFSYVNHFYWLYQVYEQQGQRAVFPHHGASVALVIGYWAIFRTSYLLRRISGKERETVSTWASLLNPILFLVVMKYQGFHPEWAWWVLLAMGAIEFILGQLPVSRRRGAPFQVLSSLGVTLMVASPLVRGSGNALEVIWLAGAEAFLLAGIFTRERLFRGFGLIISFMVALYAVPFRIFPLAVKIFAGQPYHGAELSLVLAVIAAVLWANAHITRRLWPSLFEEELEHQSLSALSFIASLFAVGAVYAYFADNAVAVMLALLVAWLAGTGKLFSIAEMVYQAHWVAVVAFIQVVAVDRTLEAPGLLRIPQRILAFASVAGMFYLSSRFVRLSETLNKAVFAAIYAWSATALLTLLMWYQATDWAVAVLWILLGLALSLIGQALKRTDLKWQGFALVLLSGFRALTININLTATWPHVTQRLVSVSLIALGTYLMARWAPLTRIRPVYTATGTLLLTVLAYKEAPVAWTAVTWIALALLLSAAAFAFKQEDLKWQVLVLVLLSFARSLQINFGLTETFHSITLRLISVAVTALGIYLLARWAPLPQIRPVYSVIGTFLLALLAYKEAPTPWTAVFWIGLALALCLAARWWKDRALLWQTHVLAALAAGWTLYASFAPQYRQSRVQLITVGITVALLYALTWITNIARVIEDERICQAYAWAGSLLLSWLAWYQLDPINVSLAWGVFGVLLYELPELLGTVKIDCSRSLASWHAQAYVALVSSFAHLFYANFNAPVAGVLLQVLKDPRVLTALPLAPIYFYVYWRVHSDAAGSGAAPKTMAKAVSP